MIESMVLQKYAGHFDTYCGLDCPEHAKDKDHFHRYNKLVVYFFNSYGYRDDEWPEDLTNHIWSIGDSFTIGLGQPIDEIWPKLVEQRLNRRVINVSMNGASNDWIARRACYILENLKPAVLFIQWSYLHRREHPNTELGDEDRRLHYIADNLIDPNLDENNTANFFKNLELVTSVKKETIIVHSFVPNFFATLNSATVDSFFDKLTTLNISFFKPPAQIDLSRDGHHYDVNTARSYADLYIEYSKL